MLIFVDSRIPKEAQDTLQKYGELVLFKTNGITYESISGHPDIFISHIADKWVVAPNLPVEYIDILKTNNIDFVLGEGAVGKAFPATAKYNVVATTKLLIHNFRHTDSVVTNLAEDLDLIHVHQGYTRCNLLAVRPDEFLTSDQGILKVLQNNSIKCHFVEPQSIILPGQEHGFFGGVAGIHNDKLFLLGNPDYFNDGDKLTSILSNYDYELIPLYKGPMFDGGGILFME